MLGQLAAIKEEAWVLWPLGMVVWWIQFESDECALEKSLEFKSLWNHIWDDKFYKFSKLAGAYKEEKVWR